MYLSSLQLQHFRNIAEAHLEFGKGINILVGQNGQGKTNILEAIFALALSRPFRSREKEVFIEHHADFARLKGMVHCGNNEEETLEIFWEQRSKSSAVFQRNRVQKNSAEFLSSKHFFAVLFAPEDMELPFAAPRVRRQFLSRLLSTLFPEYLAAALKYEKVLKHRNKLLQEYSEGTAQKMEFDFWDAELTKWAEVLETYTIQFFEFASTRLTQNYHAISQKKDRLTLKFIPSVAPEEDFFAVLQKNFSRDVRYGSTQRGAHRDDFALLLNDHPLEAVGSRGEVRSALLALKLCERDFIAEQTSVAPVLLLDDVFSELDEERRTALLKVFENTQVFISSTHLPEIPNTNSTFIFRIQAGKIEN